jgi:hypothetical protein
MREVVTPNRTFDTQAQNFNGARGNGDQQKLLEERVQRVQQIEDPLYGDTDTWEVLCKEKPVHRRMVEMSIQGYTPQEIADTVHYNVHYVRKVLRQPWARERIIKRVQKTVSEEIKDFLEAEVLPALKRVAATGKNNFDTEHQQYRTELGLKCDTNVIERFLGKPVQPISGNSKTPSELSDEELKTEVERELAKSQAN